VVRDGRRGKCFHPFRDFAKVTQNGCSLILQRRIVDFSAERSFGDTAKALKEHLNIDISIYSIDKVTEDVSQAAKQHNARCPDGIKPAETLISEVDGSMLPIVIFNKEKDSGKHVNTRDKRKHRLCIWKEIRVSTVSNPDAADTYYGVALEGPFGVGLMMSDCCKFKGMNNETYIHAIADGASWIADQYEKQFGSQCKFTLDFYHVCEYLADAAGCTSMNQEERNRWLEIQKSSLRESRADEVINALEMLKVTKNQDDEINAIESAIKYLTNRIDQLDYHEAIKRNLPIGSGEVESAHRHILQKRLKIPGAWWRLERAEEIAQLRAMRANNRWNEFWERKIA